MWIPLRLGLPLRINEAGPSEVLLGFGFAYDLGFDLGSDGWTSWILDRTEPSSKLVPTIAPRTFMRDTSGVSARRFASQI
jgi:hypothetical protein